MCLGGLFHPSKWRSQNMVLSGPDLLTKCRTPLENWSERTKRVTYRVRIGAVQHGVKTFLTMQNCISKKSVYPETLKKSSNNFIQISGFKCSSQIPKPPSLETNSTRHILEGPPNKNCLHSLGTVWGSSSTALESSGIAEEHSHD